MGYLGFVRILVSLLSLRRMSSTFSPLVGGRRTAYSDSRGRVASNVPIVAFTNPGSEIDFGLMTIA